MKQGRTAGGGQGENWTEDDVAKMLTNPVYAGIGPYPAMVPEDQWVQAVSKLIKERGAERVLRAMLQNLREAFPPQP